MPRSLPDRLDRAHRSRLRLGAERHLQRLRLLRRELSIRRDRQTSRAVAHSDAQLYDPQNTSVRGLHAFFLIFGRPEAYGLPPRPEAPTIYLKSSWAAAILTALGALGLCLILFGLLGHA